MGKGDGSPHPRGQREGESGGGRFPNRPYERLAYNGRPQGSPLQEKDGRVGEGEWIPASARTTGGGVGGRTVPEPPLRGVGRTAYYGRPQGSPLQGKDGGVGEGGWIPAFARTTGRGSRGGRAVPEPPLRGGHTAYIGRPQGSPLRKEWAGTGDGSPHARGQREGGVGGGRFPNRPYEGLVAQHISGDHKGRPYGRNGRGRGMGPRMREDNGRGSRGARGSRTAPTRG